MVEIAERIHCLKDRLRVSGVPERKDPVVVQIRGPRPDPPRPGIDRSVLTCKVNQSGRWPQGIVVGFDWGVNDEIKSQSNLRYPIVLWNRSASFGSDVRYPAKFICMFDDFRTIEVDHTGD